MTVRRLAAPLLALLVNLAAASLCVAQTAANEPARQLAHELFTAVGFADLIREGALSAKGFETFAKVRPEWKPLMVEAMQETVEQDQPALEAVLARAVAKSMSSAEIAAGLVVFRDAQARAAIAAAAHHQAPAVASGPPCGPDCVRAMASPAGQAFMVKMRTAFDQNVEQDMVAAIMPDLFIRFGEKAKAAEAKRNQP